MTNLNKGTIDAADSLSVKKLYTPQNEEETENNWEDNYHPMKTKAKIDIKSCVTFYSFLV